ncbi:MAG: GNAT family N-acetyltransferase [Paludibacteraceae bacterium]|nr:GNAT family N-acetyltransferase [Paludibacteraceae bacterium]
MIVGKNTKLVAFEPEHWVYIHQWMSDDYYKFYFRNIPDNLTVAQMAEFPKILGMNVLMIANENNEIIGMATWDNVRLLARQCCIGFIIDKQFKGMGFAKDAFMNFIYYLTHRLGLHKLIAKVAKDEVETVNKTVYGGFKDQVVMREEFFMDGKWHDEIWLTVLDTEVAEVYNKYKNGELKRGE